MDQKKKEKLDEILFIILSIVLAISGVAIVIGAICDNMKIMFCGLGTFALCMTGTIINQPPYYYDDKGD